MTKSLLDSTELALPCHNCSRETKKRIAWIKAHQEFTCACGATNRFDAKQLVRDIAKVDAALKALKGGLK